MPRLPYTPENFGMHMGPALTTASEIHFSWADLIRAAITVGRRNCGDVTQHGVYSVLEAAWRIAMIRANLIELPDGRLKLSSAFNALDPSEKGAVSYFFGLALTKLVAEKLFGVAWLLHLDVYQQHLNPHLAFAEKPDFVGLDARHQWLVMESKGRTNSIRNHDLKTAKRQTRSLRHLNGQLPALRVAVGTYFGGGPGRARILDPDECDERAVDLVLSPENWLRAYYRPIVEIVDAFEQRPLPDGVLSGFAFRGLDASVTLDADVLAWYRDDPALKRGEFLNPPSQRSILEEIAELKRRPGEGRPALSRSDPNKMRALDDARLKESFNIGLDGVTVALGATWDREIMRRQPQDRGH